MREIGFVVGFGRGGASCSIIPRDLIHNGFGLTEFLQKGPHLG